MYLDCCFIVLKGVVYSRKLRREDIGDRMEYDQKEQERLLLLASSTSPKKSPTRRLTSNNNPNPIKKMRKIQEFHCGKFVGSEYWRGRGRWKYGKFKNII